MDSDDALFQPPRTRTRHQLEELLTKAERAPLIDADKTPEPRSKYRDIRTHLNDVTLYDPEPLVFPNSTLQSQSNLGGLSVSGLDGLVSREEKKDDVEESEAGTIFSDSVTNSTQQPSPRPTTPPQLTAADVEETPLKASLHALSRPPSQRPSPLPFTRSQSVPVDTDTQPEREEHRRASISPPLLNSNSSSQKTSPILANVSTPFRNRMKYNRANFSNNTPQAAPPPPRTQPRSAPSAMLPSTTPKVSPPRRRSYVHDYAESVNEADVETSSSTTSLPQVDTGSVENSPVKPPPRPRWSFGGRMSARGTSGEQNSPQRFRDIEEPVKDGVDERPHPQGTAPRSAQSSPHNRSKSFKSSFKAGTNAGSKSVSFVNGLDGQDDRLDESDSDDFINNAHDALVQLEDNVERESKESPQKAESVSTPNDSNSFNRYLENHNDIKSEGNSTHLNAGDLARDAPNYSVMKTPQAPGFYPMTPAHIPRNRQSTPVKGDNEEDEGGNSSAEFDLTKLDNKLDLSTGRMSMLKTPQAPGFYPMTPAHAHKASPMSSNDSFDVVDDYDNGKDEKASAGMEKAAPDASLFVALSDIEEALKSTAADVERRKKERLPQTHNTILDVFRSDRSGEGMAKKAHTRTTDALAAYNEYTQRDKSTPSAATRRQIRRASATNPTPGRVNTFNIFILITQLIAGYLILQHLYNILFNSFLTNYFDPLNPDIHISEYAHTADNRTFQYRGLLDRVHDFISVISNEYIYGRPWPPS